LVPAVATVLPHSRYQFCQAHYLRNLAAPLAEADAGSCTWALRINTTGSPVDRHRIKKV